MLNKSPPTVQKKRNETKTGHWTWTWLPVNGNKGSACSSCGFQLKSCSGNDAEDAGRDRTTLTATCLEMNTRPRKKSKPVTETGELPRGQPRSVAIPRMRLKAIIYLYVCQYGWEEVSWPSCPPEWHQYAEEVNDKQLTEFNTVELLGWQKWILKANPRQQSALKFIIFIASNCSYY